MCSHPCRICVCRASASVGRLRLSGVCVYRASASDGRPRPCRRPHPRLLCVRGASASAGRPQLRGVCIRTTRGCGRGKTRVPSATHHRQRSASASYLKDEATIFVDDCGDGNLSFTLMVEVVKGSESRVLGEQPMLLSMPPSKSTARTAKAIELVGNLARVCVDASLTSPTAPEHVEAALAVVDQHRLVQRPKGVKGFRRHGSFRLE